VAAEAAVGAADALRGAGEQRRAAAQAARAEALQAQCEGAVTPGLVAAPSVVPLTGREREVAVLAAAGVSSKEIAERLYLSVRTVNNHLQHAYTKLGVVSRRELAVALGVAAGE
jgi:DNA-binding CsgD family transcriptional regulator